MLPSPPRRCRSLCALALPLLLGSCFTMGLWGFLPETETNPFTGEDETVFEYQADTGWSWGLFAKRVLLTPITVGLDIVTCPVQAFLWGDDDDECDRRPRHR